MLKQFLEEKIFKYYYQYQKLIMVGFLCLLIILFSLVIYQYENKIKTLSKAKQIVLDEEPEKEIVEEPKNHYYVDIKGAINAPNVYKVEEGQRIIDVINLAGGLIENANTSVLNLSKKITDEMVIIIYTNDEIKQFKENNKEEIIKYIEKDCNCPDPNINNACINSNNETEVSANSTKVSLNNASKEELMTLPGIGESKAQAIIDYRVNSGPFDNIEEVKDVTGIGDSIFDKIKDFITT